MNSYHPIVFTLRALLDSESIPYETFEHEAVRTSEEAAQSRDGYTLQQGAKAIIIRVKEKLTSRIFFAVVVVPGDKRFDNKTLKQLLNAKDIRFATEEEVAEVTGGVQVGGVPPFGSIFGLPTYVDESLYENDHIIFNAGDRRFSIGMKSADYRAICKTTVVSIMPE